MPRPVCSPVVSAFPPCRENARQALETQAACLLEAASVTLRASRGNDGEERRKRLMAAVMDAGRRGATQVELAEIIRVQPGVVSRMIDRLEARQALLREPHPLDRRSKVVQLTEGGREMLRRWRDRRAERLAAACSILDTEELAVLNGLLERLVAGLPDDGVRRRSFS